MIDVRETGIPQCLELRPRCMRDVRGCFVKTFQASEFARLGLATDFREQYFSVSRRGVIRGLHFQLPPHDVAKLVTCLDGAVMDVVVDLRQGSPTFGQHRVIELAGELANQVYVPRGVAHAFCVRSETALLLYDVTAEYAPQHDSGVLWNSAGISWPIERPIISERDGQFVMLADFQTPFRFEG